MAPVEAKMSAEKALSEMASAEALVRAAPKERQRRRPEEAPVPAAASGRVPCGARPAATERVSFVRPKGRLVEAARRPHNKSAESPGGVLTDCTPNGKQAQIHGEPD